MYGLFTLYFFSCYHIVTSNYVFILLYMRLYEYIYKHISYVTKSHFCIFIQNKYLVSFVLDFLSPLKVEHVLIGFHSF